MKPTDHKAYLEHVLAEIESAEEAVKKAQETYHAAQSRLTSLKAIAQGIQVIIGIPASSSAPTQAAPAIVSRATGSLTDAVRACLSSGPQDTGTVIKFVQQNFDVGVPRHSVRSTLSVLKRTGKVLRSESGKWSLVKKEDA